MTRLKASLHSRFLATIIAITGALMVVASTALFHMVRNHFVEAEKASVTAMVSAVEKTLAVGIYARDNVLLQELLDGLAHHPTVLQAQILDQSKFFLSLAKRAHQEVTNSPDFEVVLNSPFDANERLGTLQIWLDAESLSKQAGQQARLLVAAMVVVNCVVLVVFNALAKRMLSVPMHRLARNLADAQPGSPYRLPVLPQHAHDEVGVVTQAANKLLDLQEHALARERDMREAIERIEARYRSILESSNAGIFLASADGRILHANPALWRLLGRSVLESDQLIGPPFADLEKLTELIQRALDSQQAESADFALHHPDGRQTWAHCMLKVATGLPDEGPHIEGVLYDITKQHQREHAIRHLAEHDSLTGLKSRAFVESWLDTRIAQARQDHESVTLLYLDLDGFKAVNDEWGHAAGDSVLIEAAQRLRTLFKRHTDVIGRVGGDELVVAMANTSTDDPPTLALAAEVVHAMGQAFSVSATAQARLGASVGLACFPLHSDDTQTLLRAADAAMYAVKRQGKGGYAVASSVTEPHRTIAPPADPCPHAETRDLDPLTGLSERRGLVNQLARMKEALVRQGGCVSVVCLDLDDFKAVNLAYGPQAGDEVLRTLATQLREVVRRQDFVARTGSDEFVLLIPTEPGSPVDPIELTRKILASLATRMANVRLSNGHDVVIQASKGVSLLSADSVDPQQVLQEAQLASRLAKVQLRGDLLPFEPNMMEGFLQQRSLEEDLRQAIALDQLRMLVQPQKDSRGRIIGGEALLRWQHPHKGLISPAEFIPLAERTGLIMELGEWVLNHGCALLAKIQTSAPQVSLSINISAKQFNHPGFMDDVLQALALNGAPANRLILELTESLFLTDLRQVTQKMHRIAEHGVRFSVDDFGTGFSSLSYLHRLPLHELKIDRSFVSALPHDQASVGIVRSIIAMGHHLQLNLVAEGVEYEEQAQFLAANQCEIQQGWFHGHPMPVENFLQQIQAHQPTDAVAIPAPSPG